MSAPRAPIARRLIVAGAVVALAGGALPGVAGGRTAMHVEEGRNPVPAAIPLAASAPTPTPAPAPTLAPTPIPAPAPDAPRITSEVATTEAGTGQPAAPRVVDPLLPAGAPPSASAAGALVAGFPTAVPIVVGSTIVSSALDSNGTIVQATVVATTTSSADEVIALYREAFTRLGLPSSPAPSVAGDRALAFARDGATVTLTVGPDGAATAYSLFAVIDVP